jgi:predicted phage-related endonuclease
MRNTTLTDEQKAKRMKGLGGTDAKKIMEGEWTKLWMEKTGRSEPDDLTAIFKVQLGINTEAFNLWWLQQSTDFKLQFPDVGETFYHPDFKQLLCHPDAIAISSGDIIDAKHLAPKAPWNSEEDVIKRYFWQAQHNMMVLNRSKFWLSIIWGNEFGEPLLIEANPKQQELLLDRELAFWSHVESDTPPMDPEAEETPEISMDDMRTVDMEGNNAWCDNAIAFLDNQDGAKKFEKAKKEIKESVEADVKHAFGHGVQAKRSKSGSINITKIKEKK